MSEWKKTRLGAICLPDGIQTGPFGSQLHQRDYSEAGTPVIMPKDIHDGTISEEGIARVSQEHVRRLKRHKVNENDIIYPRRGDVGKSAFITKRETGWLCGTGCLRVSIDAAKALPRYVHLYLSLVDSVKWIENHSVGATMPNINSEILANVPIALPSLSIQDRIAGILSDYDSAIANCRKQIALLEEAAMRLYREWFKDGKGEKKRLVEIADVTYGYPFSSSLFNSKHEGLPIIRIRNVPLGFSDDYTTEVAKEAYLVHDGDLLIGMDGEFHMNFWSGGNAWLVQRTCRIQPKDSMLTGFLMEAIKNPIRAFQSSIVGSTVGHLGKSDIDTVDVPVIDDDRIPIAEVLQKMYCERLALSLQIRTLTEARDRLLPKLMKGEVAV